MSFSRTYEIIIPFKLKWGLIVVFASFVTDLVSLNEQILLALSITVCKKVIRNFSPLFRQHRTFKIQWTAWELHNWLRWTGYSSLFNLISKQQFLSLKQSPGWKLPICLQELKFWGKCLLNKTSIEKRCFLVKFQVSGSTRLCLFSQNPELVLLW